MPSLPSPSTPDDLFSVGHFLLPFNRVHSKIWANAINRTSISWGKLSKTLSLERNMQVHKDLQFAPELKRRRGLSSGYPFSAAAFDENSFQPLLIKLLLATGLLERKRNPIHSEHAITKASFARRLLKNLREAHSLWSVGMHQLYFMHACVLLSPASAICRSKFFWNALDPFARVLLKIVSACLQAMAFQSWFCWFKRPALAWSHEWNHMNEIKYVL